MEVHYFDFSYQKTPAMAPDISRLTSEVINSIASTIQIKDLLSLRLVCKAFYNGSLNTFATSCVQTVTTDLSTRSLEALQALAKNASYKSCVQCLVIDTRSERLGMGFRWRRHETGYIIQPGTAFRQFRALLADKLTKCRCFQFIGPGDNGRAVDDKTILTPTDTVAIVLTIIAETALAVKAFRMDFSSNNNCAVWDSDRFNSAYCRTHEFAWVWSSLAQLNLRVSLTQNNLRTMRNLTCNAKYLRQLSLDLKMLSPALFPELLPSGCCNHLEELRLIRVEATFDALKELLLRSSQSLRKLVLEGCSLHGKNSCFSILRLLATNFPRLVGIAMRSLQDVGVGNQRDLIVFNGLGNFGLPIKVECQPHGMVNGNGTHHQDLMVGIAYQGPAIEQALAALSAVLKVTPGPAR